jgi:hypothetical protein
MDSTLEPGLKKSLIVLLPEGLTGSSDLAKKIYWLATRDHCDVFYLAIVDDEQTKLSVARHLATLKALTFSQQIAVNSKISNSAEWLNTLKGLFRPGDMIVCHEEQYVRNGFMNATPMKAILSETFKAHIYTLTGFYQPWHVLTRKWLLGILFWVGCLAILGGFGLLEIQIDRTVQGAAGTALIFVILAFEFAAFWAWNHIPKI